MLAAPIPGDDRDLIIARRFLGEDAWPTTAP